MGSSAKRSSQATGAGRLSLSGISLSGKDERYGPGIEPAQESKRCQHSGLGTQVQDRTEWRNGRGGGEKGGYFRSIAAQGWSEVGIWDVSLEIMEAMKQMKSTVHGWYPKRVPWPRGNV